MMYYVTTHLVIAPEREDVYEMHEVNDALAAIRDDHEVVYVRDERVAKAILKAGGTSEREANRRIKFAMTGELDPV